MKDALIKRKPHFQCQQRFLPILPISVTGTHVFRINDRLVLITITYSYEVQLQNIKITQFFLERPTDLFFLTSLVLLYNVNSVGIQVLRTVTTPKK